MVGVNGNKFPAIRAHLQHNIAQAYKDFNVSYVPAQMATPRSLEHSFSASIASQVTLRRIQMPVRPSCVVEPFIVLIFTDKVAIDRFNPGDAVVIFTPDSKCSVHTQKVGSY